MSSDKHLQNDEVISQDDITTLRNGYKKHLDAQLEESKRFVPMNKSLGGKWKEMVIPNSSDAIRDPETGVNVDTLTAIGKVSVSVPDSFVSVVYYSCCRSMAQEAQVIHPRLKRHINARLKSVESGTGLDWATAEVCPDLSFQLQIKLRLTPSGHGVRVAHDGWL